MDWDMRTLREPEFDEYYDLLDRAFGGAPEPAEERAVWRELTDFDRFLVTRDPDSPGREIIGTGGSFAVRMTVPGGALVPTAGVTLVSVAATHTRRGALTALMRRLLDGVHERGESVAALWASEHGIYGRFGYGVATRHLGAEIDIARTRLSFPPGTDEVKLRYADVAASAADCRALFAQLLPGRAGLLERDAPWDRMRTLDLPEGRAGASALNCVLAEREGRLVGYVRFAVKGEFGTGGPQGTVVVRELEALDAATRAALWRFLCRIDLCSTVSARSLPLDEPLQYLAADTRRLGLTQRDSLHVRLVDVPAALSARTYQVPVDVVLQVDDAFCPWNEGRWRLRGDSSGATCEPCTDREPDLALSVRELGAAYLGGTPLSGLARAGRVRELRPGTLAAADLAFGAEAAPFASQSF